MEPYPFPSDWGWLVALGALIAAGSLYLAPTAIAADRRHFRIVRIALVNVLLGWTVAGWVWALRMALGESVGRCPYCGEERG